MLTAAPSVPKKAPRDKNNPAYLPLRPWNGLIPTQQAIQPPVMTLTHPVHTTLLFA